MRSERILRIKPALEEEDEQAQEDNVLSPFNQEMPRGYVFKRATEGCEKVVGR